jgi:hypothetical protein
MKDREEYQEVGIFEVSSGALMVSDPCYKRGTWCHGILGNARNGHWVAKIRRSDEGMWGNRVAELYVHLKGDSTEPTKKSKFTVGVDAGQVCIVDEASYPQGETGEYGEKDTFYGEACEASLRLIRENHQLKEVSGAGIIAKGRGVNSSSGYGDGSYRCMYGTDSDGKIVSVKVIFIEDESTCENCGEWCEEDELVDGECPGCRGMDRCEECGFHFHAHQMNEEGNICLECIEVDKEEEKDAV